MTRANMRLSALQSGRDEARKTSRAKGNLTEEGA